MANHKFLWTAPVLALSLICSMTATVGVAAPPVGVAAPSARVAAPPANVATPPLVHTPKKSLTFSEKVKVRTREEKRLASLDKAYAKQMKALAKQYKALAKLVAKQGGDSTALNKAAAYFENNSKVQEKKEKIKAKLNHALFINGR